MTVGINWIFDTRHPALGLSMLRSQSGWSRMKVKPFF